MVVLLKNKSFFSRVSNSFRENCLYLPILLIFGCAVTSCSKSNTIPDPPHLKTQLVSELFASLRQENWKIASEKINRIKEISPDEIALPGIEAIVKNNVIIQSVQKELDNGNIDEAIRILNDFTEKNGQTIDFRDAIKELNTLKEIRVLSEAVTAEEDSVHLAYATARLKKTISTYPEAKKLQSFTDREVIRVQELKNKERFIGLEDLRADIDIELIRDISIADTLIAMFEAINPNDDLPLSYRKGLDKDWSELNFAENYLNSNLEYIFFRTILVSKNQSCYKDLKSKLISLKPNNYRTMLIRALFLNMAGKIDDSVSILAAIKEELAINDSQYQSWFVFSPIKNMSIYEINPLALFPFFIYIPADVKLLTKQ